MFSTAIVEQLDIFKDFRSRVLSRFVSIEVHMFRLKRVKEAFCYSVVVAVAGPAHAQLDSVFFGTEMQFFAGVLRSSIRVENEAR